MQGPPPDALEVFGWVAQIALLAALATRRARLALPDATLAACVVVILAAWLFRLAQLFALASGGLDFWIGDDALRWSRAARWWSDPFFVRPGDPWLVGGYVLHGLAMEGFGDPLAGSKLLSALLTVLPLTGLFLFAQAIFDRLVLSCACVVVAAPWWIHILLSSGSMTEMPTTGLLLGGAALVIFAVREDTTRRRRRLLAGSALCFAAATSLHFASWLQLAAVIGCLFGYSVTRPAARRGGALREWAGFAVLSTPFCVAWMLRSWTLTGSPVGPLEDIATLSIWKLGGPGASWLENGAVYPAAVVYSVRAFLPLVAWGVAWPFFAASEAARRARFVLGGLGIALLLLVATALGSGTNLTPFRTVTALTTALLPFALAPLWLEDRAPRPGGRWAGLAGSALAVLVLASLFLVNHQRVFLEAPAPTATPLQVDHASALRSDARALGAWLRREQAVPVLLTRRQLDRPFLVALSPASVFKRIALEYAIGDPRRIEYVAAEDATVLPPEADRILISDRPIDHPELRPVTRIASYHVYASAPER